MKAKLAEDKQKKLDDLKVKKLAAKAKSEDAEAAFQAWKNKKDEERKKSGQGPVKVNRQKQNGEVEKVKKLEAAAEAYENWLEFIEQREQEEKYAEEERLLREMWRPPWYPAGVADP